MPAAITSPFTGLVGREAHDDWEALRAGRLDIGEAVLVSVCRLGCALCAKPKVAIAVVADVKLFGVCDFGGCWSGHFESFGWWVRAWPGGDA
jgi:hypothetical protein